MIKLLAGHWRQLLLIEIVTGAVAAAALVPFLFDPDVQSWVWMNVTSALTSAATGAVSWSAGVAVLGGASLAQAARQSFSRRTLMLFGWFAFFSVLQGAPMWWAMSDLDVPTMRLLGSWPFDLLRSYLDFCLALLALVVLLEGRGPVRSWLLVHRRLRTAVPVFLMLVAGELIDRIVDPIPVALAVVVDLLIVIPITVAYYVIYMNTITPSPVEEEQLTDPVEPGVIDLGRV